MRKFTFRLMAVFLGFCLTSAALAIDVPLKYQKHPDKTEDYYPSGAVSLKKTLKPPSGEWKLPQLVSEHPLYAFMKIGDKERLCVFDRQKAGDSFYNRFYFDSNINGDLTDDPFVDGSIEFRSNNRFCVVNFPAVDIRIEVDGKSLPFSFRPVASSYMLEQLAKQGYNEKNIERFLNFYLRTNCSYTGEFQLKGQKYRVVLGDSNCSGHFDEKFARREIKFEGRIRIYSEGDSFILTTSDKIDYYDAQVCSDLFQLNDQLYEVRINTTEGKMTLAPVTKDLVPLHLAMKVERIQLYTEDGKNCLMMFQPSQKIKVPAGKYRLYDYQVFKKDEQGDLWRLRAAATTESPYVTVDGKSDSLVEFGEPFVPIVDVVTRGGTSRAYLLFNVEGKCKEFLTDLSHVAGTQTTIPLSEEEDLGHRPKEPTYKIIKADGEVVTQGSFRYG